MKKKSTKSTKSTKAKITKTKFSKLQLRQEAKVDPLINKPAVTRVKVAVVRVVDDLKTLDGITTLITFEGNLNAPFTNIVDWTVFSRIDLKFGNQSDPSDWYTVTHYEDPAAVESQLAAFLPSGSNIQNILYIAPGIQAKLQNAYDNNIKTVPLRLYTDLLPYNTTDPSKPINPFIFSIYFDYTDDGPMR